MPLVSSFNVVLFALDQFIITVAVPQIVSEFNALDQGGFQSSLYPFIHAMPFDC
jgi:hypothetical protein